jgi:hypothetical protein
MWRRYGNYGSGAETRDTPVPLICKVEQLIWHKYFVLVFQTQIRKSEIFKKIWGAKYASLLRIQSKRIIMIPYQRESW